jgi:hypothetical protein
VPKSGHCERQLWQAVGEHPKNAYVGNQPVAVSQWPDQQPSPSVITPIIEIGA